MPKSKFITMISENHHIILFNILTFEWVTVFKINLVSFKKMESIEGFITWKTQIYLAPTTWTIFMSFKKWIERSKVIVLN